MPIRPPNGLPLIGASALCDHRVPLGQGPRQHGRGRVKLATLTLLWGEPPLLGEYFKAERGRTAYRIVEIVWPKRPGAKVRLRCERCDPARLEPDAVVHGWVWAKR